MDSPPAARPPLDAERLRGLHHHGLRFEVHIVDEALSTNGLATQWAQGEAAEGLVVVAEHQTAGRGRLDRVWETPDRAALTLSVVLRPEVEAGQWPWIPLLMGVAVADALRGGGAAAELKWPNDVLIGGRKVAGILVERVDTPVGPAAVAGVGINVSTTVEELPVPEATSLALEGVVVDRTALLAAVLEALADRYAAWLADPATLRAAYVDRCATVPGRRVRVLLPDGRSLTGTTRDLAESGGLVVVTDEGEVTVNAGDVVHLRPADQ
ncbi:MAG: biotin--[acetyl-CoA-carboxylase] ligase [Nocardioidaceae bacterium]